jgi:hypothetical protein
MLLRRIIREEGATILGRKPSSGHYEGILIANISPGESSPRSYRIRRDYPDIDVKSDGTVKEKNKYLSPPGDRNQIYYVPGTDPSLLADPTLSVVFTEGEFKGAAVFRLSWNGISQSDPRPRFLACASAAYGTGAANEAKPSDRRANPGT